MGYIYLVTNTINNKNYVGQTRCPNIETRWNQHRKCDKQSIGRHLLNAYLKYGIEKFKFKIICICFDEDLNKYESEYISKMNTIAPNGYNLRSGGHNTYHHEETIKIMSEKTKLMMTPEYRRILSEKLRSNPSLKGRVISEEQKQKLRDSANKYWASKSPEERRYSKDDKKIKSITSHVKEVLDNGRRKNIEANSKKVLKYSISNDLLASYKSISEASRENNIVFSSISKVCRGIDKYKTAGGFIWKYA
jgi:group I intron endonuclease